MSRINKILTLLLILVVGLAAWVRIDFTMPNVEFLPDMKYTVAWQSYSPNSVFADGRTMQAPVAGTIARGERPLHYSASKEDAVKAGEELKNPYHVPTSELGVAPDVPSSTEEILNKNPDVDEVRKVPDSSRESQPVSVADSESSALKRSVERGGERFRIYCIACHGPKGMGDGLVAQRGFPPPPSLLTGKSIQMKDGQLFHILTYGQGSMAPFAGQISQETRWDLINFIRDLQKNNTSIATGATP